MSKTAVIEPAPSDVVYDLVDVLDEDNQDWLPLGEPEDIALLNSDAEPATAVQTAEKGR